jgi:hypothetical protein
MSVRSNPDICRILFSNWYKSNQAKSKLAFAVSVCVEVELRLITN